MSFKRRLKFQMEGFRHAWRTLEYPAWFAARSTKLTLLALAAVLSVFYVFKTSSAAISGYEINNLEQQVAVLQTEIRKLEVETASYGSISSIQNRLAETKMVAVSEVKYLNPLGSAVAVK